jgi:putative sterol carrier protein
MSTAFDDVRVGSQMTSPAVHLGSATNAGQLGGLASLLESVQPCPDAELVELTWTHRGSPDGLAHLVATVTRCGPDSEAGAARIVQDLRLVDGVGDEAQQARARWRVAGVAVSDDPARAAYEFGSVAWGRRVGERLAKNPVFRSTTTPFDGAIGFSAGPDEVSFRIYRGEIVEVARKAVDGPTFTVDAAELTWLQLLTAPTNDFVRRTMTGAFKVRGNGFQYVRMIKAVMLIIDAARAELAEALDA